MQVNGTIPLPPIGCVSGRRFAVIDQAESIIRRIAEITAAAIIVIETVLLAAGVVWRYWLRSPIIWVDELASGLLLWLGLVGSIVAYLGFSHMRMGALVDRAQSRWAERVESFSLAVGVALLSVLIKPAVEMCIDEAVVTTPTLGISGAWRALAVPIGLGTMLVVGVLRILRAPKPVDIALAFALLAGLCAALYLAAPVLAAMGNYRLIVFFVILVGGAVLLGIPIAFAFGVGTCAYIMLSGRTPLTVLIGRIDEGISHSILLAVPLFVLLGYLMELTGMARQMVAVLSDLVGHLRGGLHYVLIGAMYLVSGISGSKAADIAAVAPALLPEMKRRGEDEAELTALLAATGAQTETIPPSLVLITVGSVSSVSISALFTGGLLPAAVLGSGLCLVVAWQSRQRTRADVVRADVSQILRTTLLALPALFLPILIRAAVVEGVATATEVSTVGIFYCLLYGLVVHYAFGRQVEWHRCWPALVGTASLSGAILLILGMATAMAWALTQSGFSAALTSSMIALPGGAAAFIAVSILLFIVLGSILEGIPAIVLLGPLFFPIARTLGIHEVHYTMVVVVAMGLGLFAPPFGIGYYVACAISGVDPSRPIRPLLPYLAVLLVGLCVIAAIPWLSIGFL